MGLVTITSSGWYGVSESPETLALPKGCTEPSWKKLCLISEGGIMRITKEVLHSFFSYKVGKKISMLSGTHIVLTSKKIVSFLSSVCRTAVLLFCNVIN